MQKLKRREASNLVNLTYLAEPAPEPAIFLLGLDTHLCLTQAVRPCVTCPSSPFSQTLSFSSASSFFLLEVLVWNPLHPLPDKRGLSTNAAFSDKPSVTLQSKFGCSLFVTPSHVPLTLTFSFLELVIVCSGWCGSVGSSVILYPRVSNSFSLGSTSASRLPSKGRM